MNQIVPLGDQPFKKEWLRYYSELPKKVYTFAFIDPALSESDSADFTALTIIDVGTDKRWFLRLAQRFRINPSGIVDLIFTVNEKFKPLIIGIEDVAFQKALLYMVSEEMQRRGTVVPLKGVKPSTTSSKEMRILGLVPRFEWGTLLINQGLHDFEMEYSQFPRSSHDDLLDSLQYMEQIVVYPLEEKQNYDNIAPNHPDYEKHFISRLGTNKDRRTDQDEF